MIRKFISSLAISIILMIGVGVAAFPQSVGAACSGANCITEGSNNAKTGGAKSNDVATLIETVTNLLLFFIGAVSVIYIVLGGIKYTTSNGDTNAIKSAKDTIMYAVIGLIAAIAAYAIVQAVINAFL